ncbi:MAG: glycosyl transferase family 2 [Thermoanaerobaculia bacterium]|jgi:glycosyltransferase involved in cell wall biosynthesis
MSPPAPDAAIAALASEIGDARIVIGIPSFNNAHSIAHVAVTAVRGISGAFPGARALVLNSDGGSGDGTPERFAESAIAARAELGADGVAAIRAASIRYRGPSGKGSAFRDIFEVASRVGAAAVVVLDADLRSVTPEWIERLAAPVESGAHDFVAPLYRRHKFDGTITNSIIFPMTAALYGGNVRQPIGGDFGVGAQLVRLYLDTDVWSTDVARFGIDIWMTTTALAARFRVAQAHLGAKVHDPKDPGHHLAKMLVEVVGTAFGLLETYENVWTNGVPSTIAPILGDPVDTPHDPVNVDVGRMLEQFRFGVETLRPVYALAMPEAILERVTAVASSNGAEGVDDVLWTRIVYAFAIAYRRRVIPRDQLLSSLTPLYLGRVASFIVANQRKSDEEAEEQIQQLARTFRSLRSDFVAAWREERRP